MRKCYLSNFVLTNELLKIVLYNIYVMWELNTAVLSKSIILWQVHFADPSPMSESPVAAGDKENGKYTIEFRYFNS